MSDVVSAFCSQNKTLFEKVSDKYENMRDIDDVMYTILNYDKILSEMCEYLQGYINYKENGDDKYKSKVLLSTKTFYDKMFHDKGYRKNISLREMRSINETFLKESKKFQDMLTKLEETKDHEIKQLISLSKNQYTKVSRVYHDDMTIYLWLKAGNSKVFKPVISSKLKTDFADKTTPVMHKA